MNEKQKNNSDKESTRNVYDDDNIPEIDTVDLVPGERDDRPRKDGPGGN